MLDLNAVIQNVKGWARTVGAMQRDNLGKENLLIETKSSIVDLVTEVDRMSEEHIINAIKNNYPGHAILSEESGKHDIESDYLWVIDPLDGTTNYAQGLPLFAISIALKYKDDTILGVIYLPVLEQMFEAIKGQKAFLNGKEISVGNKVDLGQCVLATGFPYDRATHHDNNLNYFSRIMPKVRGLRRMGSAAYDLANVAAGILDGYWELNLSIWDVAAGALIVEESGGKVVYLSEKRGVSLVAGNKVICKRILSEIQEQDETLGI